MLLPALAWPGDRGAGLGAVVEGHRGDHGVTGCDALAERLFHASDGSASHSVAENLSAGLTQAGTLGSWSGVVDVVMGHIDLPALLSIQNIEISIAQAVNVLTPHHMPHLGSVVALLKELPLFRLFILKIKNVVGRTRLIGVANLVFALHQFDLLVIPRILFFHVFPSL